MMSKGMVSLSSILQEAKADNSEAVAALFSGFLSKGETIRGCGYLGCLGFIFPQHSFWCVTDTRACSLRLKRDGELLFSSGCLAHINSDAFYQPSLLILWVCITLLVVVTFGIGLLLIPIAIRIFYRVKKSGMVFWVREGVGVYIFADRHNLQNAQRASTLIAEAVKSEQRL